MRLQNKLNPVNDDSVTEIRISPALLAGRRCECDIGTAPSGP